MYKYVSNSHVYIIIFFFCKKKKLIYKKSYSIKSSSKQKE